jgi:hypothetical protein
MSTGPNPRWCRGLGTITNQVLPLGELNIMDLVDDEYQVTDELTAVPTPGHVSLVLSFNAQRGYILGDGAHNPAQVHYTDWNPVFDIQHDLSGQTPHTVWTNWRPRIEGIVVSAGYFPTRGLGGSCARGVAGSGRVFRPGGVLPWPRNG